jgi:hypothetical protein
VTGHPIRLDDANGAIFHERDCVHRGEVAFAGRQPDIKLGAQHAIALAIQPMTLDLAA